MNLDPSVELLLRFAFGILFASALVHKLCNWTEFLGVTSSYIRGVLPDSGRVFVAAIVAIMEAAVVSACAIAPGAMAGIAVILALSAYALAMGLNIMRGNLLLDCGCAWGESAQPVTLSLVFRNVGLIIVAFALLLPEGTRIMAAIDYAWVLCALLLLVFLYMTANRLIANESGLVVDG